MTPATIPCTLLTRNNPGCRCTLCLAWRKRAMGDFDTRARAIADVRRSQSKKRAAPWEGQRRDRA